MSWQMFRWTWRLEGPLFVGTTPAGALNRCRPYVPARAIWGAVTAELARLQTADDPRYTEVGKKLRTNARFSYLYPTELVGQDWFAWLPGYREGEGLVWKREDWKCEDPDASLTHRGFRRRLLWTRPATAIDPDNDSALEGSLRETECVQPFWRRDEDPSESPVGLVGYVFLRNSEDLAKRLSALSTLFIGGDTRYGLGRIEQVSFELAQTLFGEDVDLDGEHPHVSTNRALAHALARDGAPMCGEQEALGGWDMTSEQKLHRVNGPVWTPGSQIADGKGTAGFYIDEQGLWHLAVHKGSQGSSNGAASL